jgi:hypothetical protein
LDGGFCGINVWKKTKMVRKINKQRYLLAFFIAAGIFVIGLLVGIVLNEAKFSQINDVEQDLRTKLFDFELQYLLMSERPCELREMGGISEELYRLTDILTELEGDLGKNNPTVSKLKEYYTLLEIRHWLFLKEIKKECYTDYDLFLYFYSNDEEECDECDRQGYVLTYLRKKYPSVRVYSFDIHLDNPSLNILKQIYNVTKVPTIVKDEKVYDHFMDRNEIEKLV